MYQRRRQLAGDVANAAYMMMRSKQWRIDWYKQSPASGLPVAGWIGDGKADDGSKAQAG
jgi:hypothetical protein